MLKRHQDERELMLAHLQDDSTEDLIDAAKTMTDEDRQKRLAELQGKRQNLYFSDPGKLTLKVVCFSRLLKCLRRLYGKQCGPRSDCSYRSSLFWVYTVCFYT